MNIRYEALLGRAKPRAREFDRPMQTCLTDSRRAADGAMASHVRGSSRGEEAAAKLHGLGGYRRICRSNHGRPAPTTSGIRPQRSNLSFGLESSLYSSLLLGPPARPTWARRPCLPPCQSTLSHCLRAPPGAAVWSSSTNSSPVLEADLFERRTAVHTAPSFRPLYRTRRGTARAALISTINPLAPAFVPFD